MIFYKISKSRGFTYLCHYRFFLRKEIIALSCLGEERLVLYRHFAAEGA